MVSCNLGGAAEENMEAKENVILCGVEGYGWSELGLSNLPLFRDLSVKKKEKNILILATNSQGA